MKEITQPQLLKLSGASQRDIENWIARLPLKTKYKPTVRGRARVFNRKNAFEITLIARLVRSGFTASAAADMVAELFREWKRSDGKGWVIFMGGKTPLPPVMPLDAAPNTEVLEALEEGGYVYTIVNVGAIDRRVVDCFIGWDADGE
jgi:hypothetical protein